MFKKPFWHLYFYGLLWLQYNILGPPNLSPVANKDAFSCTFCSIAVSDVWGEIMTTANHCIPSCTAGTPLLVDSQVERKKSVWATTPSVIVHMGDTPEGSWLKATLASCSTFELEFCHKYESGCDWRQDLEVLEWKARCSSAIETVATLWGFQRGNQSLTKASHVLHCCCSISTAALYLGIIA